MATMTKAEARVVRAAKHEARRQQQRAERMAARAERLEAAIREHHRQVVKLENWGADDELWATLRLPGRPETKAA